MQVPLNANLKRETECARKFSLSCYFLRIQISQEWHFLLNRQSHLYITNFLTFFKSLQNSGFLFFTIQSDVSPLHCKISCHHKIISPCTSCAPNSTTLPPTPPLCPTLQTEGLLTKSSISVELPWRMQKLCRTQHTHVSKVIFSGS